MSLENKDLPPTMRPESSESAPTEVPLPESVEGIEAFEEGTRAPLEVPVKLLFDSFGEMKSGYSANVSRGGMFVAGSEVRPVGTLIKFELKLSLSSAPVRGLGEVVWIRLKQRHLGQPPGMGIQFRYLDVDSLSRLDSAVRQAVVELSVPEPQQRQREGRPPRRDRLLRELEDALAHSERLGTQGKPDA